MRRAMEEPKHADWTLRADGTIRPTANPAYALTVNLTKEASEPTYKAFLWLVAGSDPDMQQFVFYEKDKTLRLRRYPDSVLGISWWTRVVNGVEVCYYDADKGLHHKANREWTLKARAPAPAAMTWTTAIAMIPANALCISFISSITIVGFCALGAMYARDLILKKKRERDPLLASCCDNQTEISFASSIHRYRRWDEK